MHFKPKNLKNRLNDRLERIRKPIESELALVFSSEQPVPSSIFQDRSAAVLETLVGYLKEKRQLPLRSIAMLLNRDERTIWTAYHRGSLKPKKHADHHPTSVPLPLEKLRNRKLSILESIVLSNSPDQVEHILTDEKTLVEKITAICASKYKQVSKRLRRAAIRSVIYLFLTKAIFAILLEVPFDS